MIWMECRQKHLCNYIFFKKNVNNKYGDNMKAAFYMLGGALLTISAIELMDSKKVKDLIKKLNKNKMTG